MSQNATSESHELFTLSPCGQLDIEDNSSSNSSPLPLRIDEDDETDLGIQHCDKQPDTAEQHSPIPENIPPESHTNSNVVPTPPEPPESQSDCDPEDTVSGPNSPRLEDFKSSPCADAEDDETILPQSPQANVEPEEEKVGRWTYSKGAARKTNNKTSNADSGSRSVIYNESQRLLRESDIRLVEHRPKQFKRFSEFRKTLHSINDAASLTSAQATESAKSDPTLDEPVDSQPETADDDQTPANEQIPVQQSSNIVPEIPPLIKLPTVDDEGFVDLGETVLPEPTPADRLLARLKAHIQPPVTVKSNGPIKYSVITKVVNNSSGTEQMQLDTVTYTPTNPTEVVGGVQARKFWRQHRRQLEEQMRERRLRLYEERMKAEGGLRPTPTAASRKQELSDDDTEWCEGEEEEDDSSSGESTSTSESDSESEEDEENADEDDEEIPLHSNRRKCPFADDEAEESDGDGHEDSDEDDASEVDDAPFQRRLPSYNPRPLESQQLSVLDDFTDIPNHSFIAPLGQSAFNNSRQPQGSLGPGDVDLFASDYSVLSNRSLNVTSVLASTRMDSTGVGENLKNMPSRSSHNGSLYSQWNDTPYELLYSQKPISQPPSFSKESSTLSSDTLILNAPPNLSSQDTLVLSQVSAANEDAELNLIDKVHGTNDTVEHPALDDSAAEHTKRHTLFGGSIIQDRSEAISNETEITPQACVSQDSQLNHEARRMMFGQFDAADEYETDLSDAPGDANSVTRQHVTQSDQTQLAEHDSQAEHAMRQNLFDSSIPADDAPTSEIRTNTLEGTQGSQLEHSMRRHLFSDSVMVNAEDTVENVSNDPPETQDSQPVHAQRRELFGNLSLATSETPVIPEVDDRSTQDSQPVHVQRRELFGNLSLDASETPVVLEVDDPSAQDSQPVHAQRRELFGNLSPATSETLAIPEVDDFSTQDSQPMHTQRRELFGNLSLAPSETPVIPEVDDFSTHDSQVEHSMRRELFGSSVIVPPADTQQSHIVQSASAIDSLCESNIADNSLKQDSTSGKTMEDEPRLSSTQLPSAPVKLDAESVTLSSAPESADDEHQTRRRHRIVFAEDLDETDPVILSRFNRANDDQKVNELVDYASEEVPPDDASTDKDEDNDLDEAGDLDAGEQEYSDDEYDDAVNADTSDEEERLREEVTNRKGRSNKLFRMDNFLEEEAELSGDENERALFGADEEDEDDDQSDLEDLELIDDQNIPSAGKLRRQVERVHQRLQADQDQRELRFLKELYFEDGDLYAENGRARQRRFKWRGLDSEDPFTTAAYDDDGDEQDSEDEDENRPPLGPMDRWLHGGLRKPSSADVNQDSVDLDAADSGLKNGGSEPAAVEVDSDNDDVESEVTELSLKSSVSNLGRQAVMKAKSQQHQIIVVSSKKPICDRGKRQDVKSSIPGSRLITGFFTKSTNVVASPGSLLSQEISMKPGKRGSLLARTSSSNAPGIVAKYTESDNIPISDEDNSNAVVGKRKQTAAQFLGLQNKVGRSCFNVRSQSVGAAVLPPTPSQTLSKPQPPLPSQLGKRSSTGSSGPAMKKQRPSSVFSALR